MARTFHMTHQSLSKSFQGFRIDTIFWQWVPNGRCRDRESTTGKKTVRVQGTASLGAWLDRTDRERTCGTRCSPASFHIASSLCDQGVPTVDTAGNSKWIFVSVSARARTDVDSTSLPSEIDRSAQSRTHCCLIYRSLARPPTITASVSVFQTSGAGKNLLLLRRRPPSRGAVSFKLQLIFCDEFLQRQASSIASFLLVCVELCEFFVPVRAYVSISIRIYVCCLFFCAVADAAEERYSVKLQLTDIWTDTTDKLTQHYTRHQFKAKNEIVVNVRTFLFSRSFPS